MCECIVTGMSTGGRRPNPSCQDLLHIHKTLKDKLLFKNREEFYVIRDHIDYMISIADLLTLR